MVSLAYFAAAATSEPKTVSAALFCVGGATVLFFSGANAMVLLATPRELQGRAMGLYLLVVLGSATVGGPLIGLVDQHFGPRIGLLLPGIVTGFAVIGVAAALSRVPSPKVARSG
jgi:MFS family permease